MEDNKYVKLIDVKNVLDLIQKRDSFHDWSLSYEEYDKKVKIAIAILEQNAINI